MKLSIVLPLALAGALTLAGAPAPRAAERPNILFLFSDDQRPDTIRAWGNKEIRTPHLDRLVAQGTSFTRTYCMGSQQGAVCVPSRAMLMTGRSLFRARETMQDQRTWPETLRAAGYTTFATGKWHNQAPSLLRSFERGRSVFLGGMGEPYALMVRDIGPDGQLTPPRKVAKHSVEQFADSAVDFLRGARGDQPFLCYVSFNLPHDPRTAPKPYHDYYNARQPSVPPNFLPQHPFNNGEMVVRDEKLAPWPRTPEVVRRHLADYYAAVEFTDAQVGRILDALKQSGRYDNTIIVYAGDHGLAIGSHGLFGKQNLYDHSMRTPLIMAGPGVPKNKRTDAMCYLLDIYPTLGELVGVGGPEGSEGKSLAPVLSGKKKTHRDLIFTAYRGFQRAVRGDRWKVIAYPHLNKRQLFDLKNDPHELRDLAGSPEYGDHLERMTARLREQQQQLGDSQALTTDNPQPEKINLNGQN